MASVQIRLILTLIGISLVFIPVSRAFSTNSIATQSLPNLEILRHDTALFNKKSGTARFTGIEQDDAASGIDLVLRAIVSDVGSIVFGIIGLFLASGYRLANQDSLSVEMLGQETRSDLLAVFASGAVLLNGVSKLDVTSALAESVVLDGIKLTEPQIFKEKEKVGNEVLWAIESFLKATPSKTAVLLEFVDNSWETLVCDGIVPREDKLRRGTALERNPILDRFRKGSSGETYLPTLQALPGRVEFTYLPSNTQEALLLPISSSEAVNVLVLGSNTAKSFTPRDVAWCQAICTRIGAEN
eukprot:CAMPEP_0194214788 /NCGR_PEP_ID=MMETSP0156-20130528/16150_1 /TAXON_ID=33649 /ORGANISM="Thalassionema nitzschioides, Strain L26-B" /LENGTH=299 /DNA_ID=CAMNT_0038943129 /DNA_START=35 /DNA_END=934 /DNA_ORIENTATION=-